MKTTLSFFIATLLVLSISTGSSGADSSRVTILKDGGGANLIENSLVGVALAVVKGADYLELPVNLTRDDQLVVFRDITLNRLTNVADLFFGRNREDGNYYVVDFSLAELRQLRLGKVFEDDISDLSLGIASLKEVLTVIRVLNNHYQQNSGVVINLIQPQFYTGMRKSPSEQLKTTLDLLSFTPEDKLFIQSSDPDELQKISRWATREDGKKFSLIQEIELQLKESEDLFSENKTTVHKIIHNSWLLTNSGRRILGSYASAVALPHELTENTELDVVRFVQSLQDYDIKVFTYLSPGAQASEERNATPLTNENDVQSSVYKYDGIYVDSLEVTGSELHANQQSMDSSRQKKENSDLPLFFSNLGLSQPKPETKKQDFMK